MLHVRKQISRLNTLPSLTAPRRQVFLIPRPRHGEPLLVVNEPLTHIEEGHLIELDVRKSKRVSFPLGREVNVLFEI